jgi:uncharacterized protein (TIGR02646 family)
MIACQRADAPELLSKYSAEITREYTTKRLETPTYQFDWPQREGQPLRAVIRSALEKMTQGHCSYCDLYPNPGGNDEIDHFRPKTRKEFYELVCEWTNLFLICTACNKAKGNKWDEALLRPDENGFAFSKYFSYRTDTAELEPNVAATPSDQHRARRTIEIFDLNRASACTQRRKEIRHILNAKSIEELFDVGYRYLISICRGVGTSKSGDLPSEFDE